MKNRYTDIHKYKNTHTHMCSHLGVRNCSRKMFLSLCIKGLGYSPGWAKLHWILSPFFLPLLLSVLSPRAALPVTTLFHAALLDLPRWPRLDITTSLLQAVAHILLPLVTENSMFFSPMTLKPYGHIGAEPRGTSFSNGQGRARDGTSCIR